MAVAQPGGELIGPPQFAHRVALATQAFVGDPQIVMRRSVRIVEAQRRFVMRDGVAELTVFEQKIPNVDDRRDAAVVVFEG